MNLQFTGNILAMGDDCVDRDAQMIGYLLVGHTLHQTYNHFFLPFAQGIIVHIAANHIGKFHRNAILMNLFFEISDCRDKDMVLYLCMLRQPEFTIVDVVECGAQLIVAQPISR